MATFYLVRHAESAPNFDMPEAEWLSATGVEQARAFAHFAVALAPTRLVSSPYGRAIATVEPLAAAAALPIAVEPDLRERQLRRGYVENWHDVLRTLWDDLDRRMPGCEFGVECRRRVDAALTALARREPAATVLACSHGNAIALFLSGIDASVGHAFWRTMRTPDVFRVHFDADRWTWDRDFAAEVCR